MYNRLKWTDNNTVPTTFNLYRGTAELDRSNLGEPLASLAAGVAEYVDEDVVAGTPYYYVIESVNENGRSASRNFKFTPTYKRGMGPSKILLGDETQGFYGEVPNEEWLTVAQLFARLEFSASTGVDTYVPLNKFIVDGVVCYVPQVGYDVVGSDLTSLINNGPVMFDFGGRRYRVRMMEGLGGSWDGTTKVTEALGPCEYDLFVSGQIKGMLSDYNRIGQFGAERTLTTFINNIEPTGSTMARRAVTAGSDGILTNNFVSWAAPALSSKWLPVIELVEAD